MRMYGHCLCRSIPYDLNDLSPGPKFHQWNTIKISLLATSRQLYEEYNLLIWHTDVFSFDDPSAFTIFLESLNNQQRKNIRNLQIRPIASKCALPGQHGILCNEYPIVHVHQWNLEDSRDPLVHRLRGVKSLHIRMKYIGSRDRIQPSRLQLELALSNLQVLRLMPLERAIVSFSIEPFNKSRTTLDPEIKRLAAMFRRKLLDPSGLEKVKNAIWFMKGLRFHSQVSMNIFNPEYMNLSKGPRVLY